jgi:molybdopterin-containing oxidoreductase family iron-sulfur binding subunit
MSDLVKIGQSRRSFLKVLGISTVVAGCADPHKEKIYPHFKESENQVPGNAVWYNSTCGECSARCGITVRTREGRAVKIEGNPEHPTNRGGLCGLGQSALQAVYDPDRIREPLERTDGTDSMGNPKVVWKPISWKDALNKVASAAVEPGKKRYFFTGETSGSLDTLLNDFTKALSIKRVTYDPMEAVELAEASELVFGTYGIPRFKFDRADVIVSFGADFLETWVSPTEFARDWASRRKESKPPMHFQIEPRLSLTGAKADKWIAVKPGTESLFAAAVLKRLIPGTSSDLAQKLEKLTEKVDVNKVAKECDISVTHIYTVASKLRDAKESIVVAGGATGRSEYGKSLQVIVAFINLVLGNVGRSVIPSDVRKPATSLLEVSKAIDDINAGGVGVVMFHGTNPVFTLPSAYGLKLALEKVKPGLVVSFSSHMDETTALADIILPIHHSLEDWGDSEVPSGGRSITQPTMNPIFSTKSFGDLLLIIANGVGKRDVTKGVETFKDYIKAQWKVSESDWRKFVEAGGDFTVAEKSAVISTDPKAFTIKLPDKHESSDLELLPFFSVKSFDGRAANRAWLQEIPDPLSLVMWDSWAEINPLTAKKLSLKTGQIAKIENRFGQLNIPVVVTEQVKDGVIAVPIGQGHEEYGRFAKVVKGGNVYNLLSRAQNGSRYLPLTNATVTVDLSPRRDKLVQTQITEDQMGRNIAKTKFLNPDGSKWINKAEEPHHAHPEPVQMYEQRKHPLYQWGMTVDLAACTGCSACVVACYAENNIPVVGKDVAYQGREMSWISIHKYVEGTGEELTVTVQPMMCQHCQNAPCEPVCPVYATYHNEEGLNAMVYNRCVGTRYCSNNCSYKVRRFNWFEFEIPETYQWQLNPDVTRRTVGVMEKCTFCVQRINEAKDKAKDEGRKVRDGEVKPACVQSCPTQALTFGNLLDKDSAVSKSSKDKRAYKVLDAYINTQPSVSYLENHKYKV